MEDSLDPGHPTLKWVGYHERWRADPAPGTCYELLPTEEGWFACVMHGGAYKIGATLSPAAEELEAAKNRSQAHWDKFQSK